MRRHSSFKYIKKYKLTYVTSKCNQQHSHFTTDYRSDSGSVGTYFVITPSLTKTIREKENQIEDLENQITELGTEISALSSTISSLEEIIQDYEGQIQELVT